MRWNGIEGLATAWDNHLTDLTLIDYVSLRAQATSPEERVLARLGLCTINSAAYVRKTTRQWTAWAASNSQSSPLFNWISIYNFNESANAQVVTLHGLQSSEVLMLIRGGHVVRCDGGPREPLVYIGFLEVAPWNRMSAAKRHFRGLGPIMLRAACDFSMQSGYDGRVGLHSVQAAEAFYRRYGFRSFDCPNEYHEMYMELDESGAQALLSE